MREEGRGTARNYRTLALSSTAAGGVAVLRAACGPTHDTDVGTRTCARAGLRSAFPYRSVSLCTRQLSSSATYSSRSDGQAISWIQPNCFGSFPASPSTPSTLPSSVTL